MNIYNLFDLSFLNQYESKIGSLRKIIMNFKNNSYFNQFWIFKLNRPCFLLYFPD